MNQRIAELENNYFEQLLSVVRMAALLVPPIAIFFGFLIRQGYLDNTYYRSDMAFLIISVLFLAAGIGQFMYRRYNPAVHIFYTSTFHILGAAYLLFVSGFDSPFLSLWILLLVAANIYFGFKAYTISVIFLFTVAILDLTIHPNITPEAAVHSFITCVFLAIVGLTITRIGSVNARERTAYNKSRRQESVQRERLTTLINAIGDAVINTDEHGAIRIYNAATLNLLDTNTALSGKYIGDILKLVDENGQPVDIFRLTKKTGHMFNRRDLSYVYENGEKMNIYINASPIRPAYQQKTQSGYIFILRDITKEKSLEEERDEFISVVSHELRTPIAISEGSLSNAQYMLEKQADSKAVASAVDAAHQQILFLAKMVNDLSTLSRAERGVADKVEEINVTDLLQHVYSEYEPQAHAKGLKLDLDLGPQLGTVMASPLYLEEVIQNFVTNSIKYTQHGSVTIHASSTKGSVTFAIRDTGIGISRSDQKRIFQKFYRSEDYRTRETTGTGLGLYVVHKLASKLRTTIEVKSRLNHGSTFSFTLQRQPPTGTPTVASPKA